MWLDAAVNLAINERRDGDPLKLKFNPFSSIVPDRGDSERRFPLDDDDIAAVKRNLGGLDKSEQLLFRVLGSTGMRLSEAFQIDGEKTERGVRYVIVGHKTDQSERRVPLPADLLPYLPKTIKGKLFAGRANEASKSSNEFFATAASRTSARYCTRCAIVRKIGASFRVPAGYRWALLGHEEKSVAEGLRQRLLGAAIEKMD